ncbi:NADP-dependent oxidoreductase [Nocardioides sp.]|uniref:NADP-dependent oxidoreductase n=1 Tax=Nocardioides sp. TaxID=35761 RepID=UPI0039E42D5B
MTRRVVAQRPGGPEVLLIEDHDTGSPGPGEVRVAVRAAAVNPLDLKERAGLRQVSWPHPLGQEAAGVVTEVGPDAVYAVGDEVVVYPAPGAYAEELVVPGDDVFSKPASLSWEEAAGLLLVGVTSVHALEWVRVAAADVVLVHGAAGGVGQVLVQLAVARGARVVGTASPRNFDLLRSLGAEPVAYGDGLADQVRAIATPTAAIDLVGTAEAIEVSLALVADRDRVTTIVGGPAAEAAGVGKIGGANSIDLGLEVRAAARAGLVAAAGRGDLRVPVARTFPLAEAAEAHRLVGAGHADGKVVLIP